MTGHVRRRGKSSWEIKFDLGRDPATGKRRIRYASFKGTKRQAEIEAAKLVTNAASGTCVEPSRLTLSEFLDRWQTSWGPANVSPKTLERYIELMRHVRSELGALHIQKLRPTMLAEMYGKLQRPKAAGGAGLAARTVGHVHRVLHRAIGHAVQWDVLPQNIVANVSPPRVEQEEIRIIKADEIGPLWRRLRGSPMYTIATLGLATGMRRGELLALRWQDVDFDRGAVRVERSLESTKAGLRFKAPKTKHGRRSITIPPTVVAELREHWKARQEQRLALGLGKAPGEALVFATLEEQPIDPDSVSKAWKRANKAAGGSPKVTLHCLRHTHVSQLIAAGVDILTISRRLGHGSPAITLSVYGHWFSSNDDRSAAIMEATFAGVGTD